MNRQISGWRRAGVFIAILSMVIAVLSACGKPNNEPTTGSGAAGDNQSAQTTQQPKESQQPQATEPPKKSDPAKISMLIQISGEIPQSGNHIEKYIEEYTNTELELQWTTSIQQKLPIIIASGDLPNAVLINNSQLRLPYMVDAFESGLFWELSDYLPDYPNLSAIDPLIYENISLEGEVYGIPTVRPLSTFAVNYRQDWAEQLGLEAPRTLDDFYGMLKAFADSDPDGNNKKDTYAVIAHKSAGIVNYIGLWLGAPNSWGIQDGQFVYAPETAEYLEALYFVKKLYDEGLMNKDFAVMEKSAAQNAFTSGKAAMFFNSTDGAFKFGITAKKTDPNAVVGLFTMLPDVLGGRVTGGNGTNGIFSFPTSSVKTEEDLRAILAFYDQLAEPDMANLFRWGIEGEHYKLENGNPVFIDEEKYTADISPFRKIMAADDSKAAQGVLPAELILEQELNALNREHVVTDPTMALYSKTYSEKGGELEQVISDAVVKFVMGSIDEAGWNQAVAEWKRIGGDQVAAEFGQSYEQMMKNQ